MESSENVYANAGVAFIETFTGIHFSLDNPVFRLRDIGHALANTCRYGGHCHYFYSVAEHSLLVAELMSHLDLGDPVEGLMHDATEAYLSDVPAPFKQLLPDWSQIDNNLEGRLREHYGIGPKTPGLKKADWIALFIEAYYLVPSKGACFLDPENLRPLALELIQDGWGIDCDEPRPAEYNFMFTAARLGLRD